MTTATDFVKLFDKNKFKSLHSEMSFSEYLDACLNTPKLARTSWQIIYDMIMEKGCSQFEENRVTYTRYNFFDDPECPIVGIEPTKDAIVKFIKGAAGHYGTEKRLLLLHGPVGSAKSTILRLIKRSMETYSKTDQGAWYSYKWVNLPTGKDGLYLSDTVNSPLNENPLKLLPPEVRLELMKKLNEVHYDKASEEERNSLYSLRCEGELNPLCKFFLNELLKKYEGDLETVLNNHIVVVRKVYSEADRCGIATFQPRDEKNQDSTELTGDIDFQKIAIFGSDSDPRSFAFSGEMCSGNRGLVEFIEGLKLDQAFLYDLLGATQEQSIKPKKFSQVSIDEAIIMHSNNPEFERLKANQYMEAFRDRTVKINVPYTLKVSEELKILEKDYGKDKVRHHVAPHTLEVAALWAVLTRLEDDKEGRISLVEKADLYDGNLLESWTEETVKELKDKHFFEGMNWGVSVRYVQDKFANVLSNHNNYINPFIIMNELKDGLNESALIVNKDQISRYKTCVDMALKKLGEILKAEVQEAMIGDEGAAIRVCSNYIDNLMAYMTKSKVKNPVTGRDEQPNERLMRSIEEKIGISNSGSDDFRQLIRGYIGELAHKNKKFSWDSNPKLRKAIELKLFEDVKDTIKLSVLSGDGSGVVDKDSQEKIDSLKTRLIKQYGYNEQSAADVLAFVASIFARGDVAQD